MAQGLVQWKGMREATVELGTLTPGRFFRIPNAYYDATQKASVVTGWTYGEVVYSTPGRVRVRLAGGQQQVVFDDSNGKSRTFESSGIAEVNYPTSLEVVALAPDANDAEAQQSPFNGTDRSRTMEAAQEKALQKKWEFASTQLEKAKAGGDADKVEVAQKRVDGIVSEAEAGGVNLGARQPGTAPAGSAKGKLTAPEQTVASETAKADQKGVAVLKAKKEKAAPRVKALPTTTLCLCGCGVESGGLFKPGHDARVKGMLSKVERGEAQFEDLYEGLKPYVKMAGAKASAGKENSTYRIVQSPVKFPGRDDIAVVKELPPVRPAK